VHEKHDAVNSVKRAAYAYVQVPFSVYRSYDVALLRVGRAGYCSHQQTPFFVKIEQEP
jgi:hypothetical protein